MGNFAAKQHAGALSAFAAAVLSLLAAAVALMLLLAAPKAACASGEPIFEAAENAAVTVGGGSCVVGWSDVNVVENENYTYVVFVPTKTLSYEESENLDALVASVSSSDESVLRVGQGGTGGYCYYYAEGLKKGSATVTMTDIYGNTYTNVVSVVYATTRDSIPYLHMHRLYNPNSGEHFYTADVNEVESLVNVGWSYEGVGWNAPRTSSTPVYRLYNPNVSPTTGSGEHHYTTSSAERDYLLSLGWRDEGTGWCSNDESTGWSDDPAVKPPLYRLYNPNEYNNNHHYTESAEERDYLLSLGWKDEGIAWYGMDIVDG